MRTNWRATCLGLMVLAPLLLTACGDDDAGAGAGDEASSTSPATSSGAPSSGVYGQPADPDAGNPTDVATDTAAPSTTATPAAPTAPAGVVVSPRLTYFGWNADIGAVEAGGIVPAIVEAGGRCTLTLSQAGTEASVSSEAIDNVTSTSCAEMVVPGEQLSPGTWRAVLRYESGTARGVSDAVEIQVP